MRFSEQVALQRLTPQSPAALGFCSATSSELDAPARREVGLPPIVGGAAPNEHERTTHALDIASYEAQKCVFSVVEKQRFNFYQLVNAYSAVWFCKLYRRFRCTYYPEIRPEPLGLHTSVTLSPGPSVPAPALRSANRPMPLFSAADRAIDRLGDRSQ
jgi:hypothetical protein